MSKWKIFIKKTVYHRSCQLVQIILLCCFVNFGTLTKASEIIDYTKLLAKSAYAPKVDNLSEKERIQLLKALEKDLVITVSNKAREEFSKKYHDVIVTKRS